MKTTDMKYPIFLVCSLLFLVGCQSSWRQQIPDGEIIYMAGYHGLGFIQPDGTHNQFIQTKVDLAKPVWSIDGKFLYGLSISGHVGNYGGYPAYWDLERGQFKVCSRGFPFFYQIQNMGKPGKPFEVIVMYVWEIKVVDLSNCRVIQTFVDYSTRPGDYSIKGGKYPSWGDR